MSDNLSNDVLIYVLAATDSLWLPNRTPLHSTRSQVLHERRRLFQDGGVTWNTSHIMPAADASARKQAERCLLSLVAAGDLIRHSTPARTLCIKLTEAADDRLRGQIGLPTLSDSLPFLAILDDEATQGKPYSHTGQLWSRETVVADVQYDGTPETNRILSNVELLALPLLWRGWIISNADAAGHVWYALIDAGKAALTTPPPTPAPYTIDPAMTAAYKARMDRELSALGTAKPIETRDIGAIPLPVGAS